MYRDVNRISYILVRNMVQSQVVLPPIKHQCVLKNAQNQPMRLVTMRISTMVLFIYYFEMEWSVDINKLKNVQVCFYYYKKKIILRWKCL